MKKRQKRGEVGKRRWRNRWTEVRISKSGLGAELRSRDPWDPPAGAPRKVSPSSSLLCPGECRQWQERTATLGGLSQPSQGDGAPWTWNQDMFVGRPRGPAKGSVRAPASPPCSQQSKHSAPWTASPEAGSHHPTQLPAGPSTEHPSFNSPLLQQMLPDPPGGPPRARLWGHPEK